MTHEEQKRLREQKLILKQQLKNDRREEKKAQASWKDFEKRMRAKGAWIE